MRVDWWPSGARLLRWPGLDRAGGQTSSGDNTLLRSVKTNAECPTVVVLVEQSHDLADAQFHFILHGGLEIELHTVD